MTLQCSGICTCAACGQTFSPRPNWHGTKPPRHCRTCLARLRTDPSHCMRIDVNATLSDETRTCVVCQRDFVTTVDEQLFLASQFGPDAVLPRRCKECRHRQREQYQRPQSDGMQA